MTDNELLLAISEIMDNYFRIEHISDCFFNYLLIFHNKKTLHSQGFSKAADGNRTRDLRTTNATLYRLSHSSIY